MSTDIALTQIVLPARGYEEAIPYLRRPYMPNQVRAKVQTTPETETAPCTIALYAIGETLTDRFNLLCGTEWTHDFTVDQMDEIKERNKRSWYCKVTATITAFGITEADIGEAFGSSRTKAEMNARAQAYKRTGRWFGPGQCLYAADEILMFRGTGTNQLCIPKGGEKPHTRVYLDAKGQTYCRDQYTRWLEHDGEAIYGEPLNHLIVAEAIRAARHARAFIPSVPPAQATAPQTAVEESHQAQQQLPTAEEGQGGPSGMPDLPPPAAAIGAARAAGYSDQVARALANLARLDGRPELSKTQMQIVEGWLGTLRRFEISDETVLNAATFNAQKPIRPERRQAVFVKWLAGKAACTGADETTEQQSNDAESTATEPALPEPSADLEISAHRELAHMNAAMTQHDYPVNVVEHLLALLTCANPGQKIELEKVPAQKLAAAADLLNSAGAVGWSAKRLDEEIRKAANSSQQSTPAGRFAAFANYLTDLAETRLHSTVAE